MEKWTDEVKGGEYNVNKNLREAFVRPGQRNKEWGFQSVSFSVVHFFNLIFRNLVCKCCVYYILELELDDWITLVMFIISRSWN